MQTKKQLENLEKGKFRDSKAGKEAGKKGGKKSGEVRRNLSHIRKWCEENLFSERGQNKIPLYEMLFKKLEQLSIQGNLKAIQMLLDYSGLKPVDKIENSNPTTIINNQLDLNSLKELKAKLK